MSKPNTFEIYSNVEDLVIPPCIENLDSRLYHVEWLHNMTSVQKPPEEEYNSAPAQRKTTLQGLTHY